MWKGFGWAIWLAIAVSVVSSVRWSARYWFRGWGTDADEPDRTDRKGRRRPRERFDFTERLLAGAKEHALPTS